jgi:hypothetical protein
MPGRELPPGLAFNDKLSHMIGHAGMAGWFAGLVPRRHWWRIFLALLALGAGIELAQERMHVGREGDPLDMAANALGALLGLAAARLGGERWPLVAERLLGRTRA